MGSFLYSPTMLAALARSLPLEAAFGIFIAASVLVTIVPRIEEWLNRKEGLPLYQASTQSIMSGTIPTAMPVTSISRQSIMSGTIPATVTTTTTTTTPSTSQQQSTTTPQGAMPRIARSLGTGSVPQVELISSSEDVSPQSLVSGRMVEWGEEYASPPPTPTETRRVRFYQVQDETPLVSNKSKMKKISKLDHDIECTRALFAEKAIEASPQELDEIGESLFFQGEMLQVNGKWEEALEVFYRAEIAQKGSILESMQKMATVMQEQGLRHGERGDDYLSVVLLGAADKLKHQPTAANLKICTAVHRGYKPKWGKDPQLKEMVKNMNESVSLVRREALALAKTLNAQADCASMV